MKLLLYKENTLEAQIFNNFRCMISINLREMIGKESRIVTLCNGYLIVTKVMRALCVDIPSEE